MTKADTIESLEAAELKRAEGWKVRAEQIAGDRAALDAEMTANEPRTAVGAQAVAEVKRALIGATGTALDRVRSRVAERNAGIDEG